jgi:hypothetical protein
MDADGGDEERSLAIPALNLTCRGRSDESLLRDSNHWHLSSESFEEVRTQARLVVTQPDVAIHNHHIQWCRYLGEDCEDARQLAAEELARLIRRDIVY